jgi:hypothetical protein
LAPLPFAESLAGRFVYDDHLLIEEPASIHSLDRLADLWQREFWGGLGAIHFRYLRPLVSTSYAVDWALWEGHPLGFHLTNLCLHAAVAVMLYAALARWSALPLGAFIATLAWAWHPSKVEAVAWIAGRTDILCALGILVACAGARRRIAGGRVTGALLEVGGLFVALASKEHGVVLPAFVALEAWSFGPKSDAGFGKHAVMRALRVASPHAAMVAAYLALRFAFYPIVPDRTATLSFVDARLYTLETIGEFAKVVFLPISPSILRAPIRVDATFRVIHDPARLAFGTALLVTTVFALFSWRRRGAAFRVAACAAGFAALLPVANVVAAKNVFLFAERFAYIPLMAFALCMLPRYGAGADEPRRVEPRGTGWRELSWGTRATWGGLLGLLALGTALHTRDFLDDRRLWQHELAVNPAHPLPLYFASQDAMHRKRYREALAFATRGYQAARGWPTPQPHRVEFALRAARSLEAITLDADRDTLAKIALFYQTFFSGHGRAEFDAPTARIGFDADEHEAGNFRKGDAARMAEVELWRAIVAARLERCDVATRGARRYLDDSARRPGRIDAILVLARCDAVDEALAEARALDQGQPPIAELVHNLEWIAALPADASDDLDAALRRSRARTLLLDRGGAYRALEPHRAAITADERGAQFFARAAWAAGDDPSARQALSLRMSPNEVEALLRAWSTELGR